VLAQSGYQAQCQQSDCQSLLTKDEARRVAANIAKLRQHIALNLTHDDYLRRRGIRNRRVVGFVSNHHSGGYDSDSNGRK
jgi:hypothetical protein